MKVLMTNQQIYDCALRLHHTFGKESLIELPVLINYAIQKNLATLLEFSRVIEQIRNSIGEKYGKQAEEGTHYKILPENISLAEKELTNLMQVEEMVEIRKIKLQDLTDLSLTNQQMQSLLFMIEEE